MSRIKRGTQIVPLNWLVVMWFRLLDQQEILNANIDNNPNPIMIDRGGA